MIVHRPEANLSPFHSFIYFTPIYLTGIVFSLYQENILKFFRRKNYIARNGGSWFIVTTNQLLWYLWKLPQG